MNQGNYGERINAKTTQKTTSDMEKLNNCLSTAGCECL